MHSKVDNIDKVEATKIDMKSTNHEDGTLRWFYALQNENTLLQANLDELLKSKSNKHLYEVKKLEKTCFKKRTEYDNLKNKNKFLVKKVKILEKKLDEFSQQESKSKNLNHKEKYIRMLENRLDKAIMKHNESQVISDTYNKLTKKFKQERAGFDSQLKTIEKSLKLNKRKSKLYEERLRDSAYERDLARSQLNKAKLEFEEMKRMKMKELAEKKKFVTSRLESTQKFSKKESERKMEELLNQGGVTAEGEKKMKTENVLRQIEGNAGVHKMRTLNMASQNMEKSWEKLRELSGEEEPEKIIAKFYSLDEVSKDLKESCEKSQEKIDKVTKRKEFYKDQMDSISNTKKTRSIGLKRIDHEMNKQLLEVQQVLDLNKQKLKKIKTVEFLILDGVSHLWKKINRIVNPVIEIKGSSENDLENGSDFQKKVLKMLEEIKSDYEKLVANERTETEEKGGDNYGVFEVSQNNSRFAVKPKKKKRRKVRTTGKKVEFDDDFLDVLDRHQLKKRSQMTIDKQRKFRKKK